LGGAVDLDEVSLDMARYADPDMQDAFVQYMLTREAKWRPDLVVPIGSPAALFVANHRARLFPETPIVYCGLDKRRLPDEALAKQAVFIGENFDIKGLMEDILTIAPGTTNVAVVIGASPVERFWTEAFRTEFNAYTNRVGFQWWNNLSFEQMLEQSKHLPPKSFIFMILLLRDASGVTHNADEALRTLHQVANAPINSIFEHQMGLGIVGGRLYRGETEGHQAAKVAARILAGEPAANFPPMVIGPTKPTYDWRELRRWGVEQSRLPAGNHIRFEEMPVWRRYLPETLSVLAALMVQTFIIIRLLMHRRRRIVAERLARENEERMKLAASAGELRLWDWDIKTDEVRVTPGEAGATSNDGEGSELFAFDRSYPHVHPDDRSYVQQALDAAFKTGEYHCTYRVKGKNDSWRWRATRGKVEYNSQKQPMRMRGVALDITARKEAEERARESENRLTHLTRVSTLGELGGSLAHELNQPLTAILSNAQAASRFLERGPESIDEVREILKDIVSEDRRAGQIIVRMRAMLKREDPKLQALDINELVHEVTGIMRSELLIRNVKVVTDLAADLPLVKGDKVRLQQVLINLVVNACDAMTQTPPPQREIIVRSRLAEGGCVEVGVADRGLGFRNGEMPEKFEPFRTTKPNGLGLGLPICRSIVEAHGGRLVAANQPQGGAEVRFTLTCNEEARP